MTISRSSGLRRREILAGLSAAALSPDVAWRTRTAHAQTPSIRDTRAMRLTRGLAASHWLEWLPAEPAAMRAKINDTYQAKDFEQIRALGFNHVRVPVHPGFIGTRLASNVPALDPERLKLFDDAMSRILQSGLALVIDCHPSQQTKDRMAREPQYRTVIAQWWQEFAGHLTNQPLYRPDDTFLELLNEPENSFDDMELYRGMMEEMIAAVRAAAPRSTLLVGGNRWNVAEAIVDGLRKPFADDNLIYAFHFYRPMEFTHQGVANAGAFYGKLRDVPWDVDAGALSDADIGRHDPSVQPALKRYSNARQRKEDLRPIFGRLRDWCRQHGQLAWLGEFGAHLRGPRPEHRAAWIRDVRQLAEEHGFGWNMWEARGGFGLFEPSQVRPLPVDRTVLAALGLDRTPT